MHPTHLGRLHCRAVARLALAAVVATAFAAVTTGCEKDPNDPKTWIAKLDHPNEFKEAVRNLDRLKEPVAITPLGKAWKKWNKPSVALLAIVNIAKYSNDGTDKKVVGPKRQPEWKDAIPWLKTAIEEFDPTVEQSVSDATIACDALAQAGDPEAIDVLVAAATKKIAKTSQANRVKLAAILALGHFKQAKAVETLVRVLETDPEEQPLGLNAAAAIALAQTGDQKALAALIKGMFLERIYPQVRGGITRLGAPAIPVLMDMFNGKNADVQELVKEKKFDEIAPGAVKFKAALLLGDMRAVAAIPMLTAELKQPGKTIYMQTVMDEKGKPQKDDKGVEKKTPSLVTQHNGVLDALRHIGPNKDSAAAVWTYLTTTEALENKPLAVDVYSMVVPYNDTSHKEELYAMWLKAKVVEGTGKNAETLTVDPQFRYAALMAFARVSKDPADSAKLKAEAAKWTSASKAAEAAMKKAADDEKYDELNTTKLEADGYAGALTEAAARIDVAIMCKDDPTCLARTVEAKDVVEGKPGLPKAERALLELSRMGADPAKHAAVAPAKPILLKNADSSVGIVREMILLALPHVVTMPCPDCADRLDTIMKAQAQKTTLDRLTGETRILYHYFLAASASNPPPK